MHLSIRSFVASAMEQLRDDVTQNAKNIVPHINVEIREGYPGWEPNPGALLEAAQRVFRQVFGSDPKVEIVHAGLECGVIADKLPGLEAVSFGPLIRSPHTPEEWVDIQSVNEIWKLLAALLEELSH
jgi:dipeptidase D